MSKAKLAKYLAVALLATAATAGAQAASIGLSSNYSLEYAVSINIREGGGVTYNWDTNRLYAIGDETDLIALDPTTGMTADYPGGLSTYRDPEGITYIGNNTYVVAQERTMEMNLLDPSFPNESDSATFCITDCSNVGNTGLEGISYDRRTGDYYAVKESGTQQVWRLTGVDFAGGGVVEQLFDASLLGLNSLSDIAALSNSDAFWGTAMGDNLLIVSVSSNLLLEVSKAGEILSRFDLSGTGIGAIEGVTVDNLGNIYLVGEQGPAGSFSWDSGMIKLTRNVVAPAVPEPATWALMIAGFGIVGSTLRRRTVRVAFA